MVTANTGPDMAMYREDILLWPNGIWCFREELHEYASRAPNYREVAYLSPEWVELLGPYLLSMG